MSLIKRLAFYLGGFGIGLVFLFFFVGGSGASCEFSYSPSARVKKNIKLKEQIITDSSSKMLNEHNQDTAAISYILKNGDVLFSESNTKLDSCKIYVIEGYPSEEIESKELYTLKLTIENCDKIATLQDVEFVKE